MAPEKRQGRAESEAVEGITAAGERLGCGKDPQELALVDELPAWDVPQLAITHRHLLVLPHRALRPALRHPALPSVRSRTRSGESPGLEVPCVLLIESPSPLCMVNEREKSGLTKTFSYSIWRSEVASAPRHDEKSLSSAAGLVP